MKNEKYSEFGKGFIYNLILFASHFERERYKDDYRMWFNGASDHLYELEIPEKWQETEIGRLAKYIQDMSLKFGHGFSQNEEYNCNKKAFEDILDSTKRLALLIDKELGVNPIKGEWE